jgi:hypothetical protein
VINTSVRLQAGHVKSEQLQSFLVTNANNKPEPKFSIETLNSDGWEARRTKQIARAVLKLKNERGYTTDQLARRCSRFMGADGSVKTATLNGLFAGKRKTVSVTEVQMFAYALDASVVDLMYPPAEVVEVRPSRFVSSADALVESLDFVLKLGNVTLPTNSRLELVLDIAKAFMQIEHETTSAIYSVRVHGDAVANPKIEMLRYRVQNLQSNLRKLVERGDKPPTHSPAMDWVVEVAPEAIGPAYLTSIEPFFKGTTVGEYRLGEPNG